MLADQPHVDLLLADLAEFRSHWKEGAKLCPRLDEIEQILNKSYPIDDTKPTDRKSPHWPSNKLG